MKQESGRTLIELMGYLAIAGILTAGAIKMYNTIHDRQIRTIASAELEQIAKNTKLLMESKGDYSGVSVDYLIEAGALKTNRAPIGSDDWSVTAGINSDEFSINLTDLSHDDCAYFTTINLNWADHVTVNGNSTTPGSYCMSTGSNKVSFVVK